MPLEPEPPESYREFVKRYPLVAEGWERIAAAGRQGPLDAKTVRLLKLALAMGAMREGAVRANIRKAPAAGITSDEIDQVLALAAGTLGLSEAVALYTWVHKTPSNEKASG
jgi:alkylhydroperoxidase/carboxymuconolactone decarboxylase family protein YurZ